MVLNIVQPAIIILLIIATILFIYLGKELKRSYVVAIPLIGYIILLLTHIFEIITLPSQYIVTLILCIIIDCIFVCVSLISFLSKYFYSLLLYLQNRIISSILKNIISICSLFQLC